MSSKLSLSWEGVLYSMDSPFSDYVLLDPREVSSTVPLTRPSFVSSGGPPGRSYCSCPRNVLSLGVTNFDSTVWLSDSPWIRLIIHTGRLNTQRTWMTRSFRRGRGYGRRFPPLGLFLDPNYFISGLNPLLRTTGHSLGKDSRHKPHFHLSYIPFSYNFPSCLLLPFGPGGCHFKNDDDDDDDLSSRISNTTKGPHPQSQEDVCTTTGPDWNIRTQYVFQTTVSGTQDFIVSSLSTCGHMTLFI